MQNNTKYPPKPKVEMHKFGPVNLNKFIDAENTASLMWSTRLGFPRVTVYTSSFKEGPVDYSKMIVAKFDNIRINVLLEGFQEIIDGPVNKKFVYDTFDVVYVDNKPTKDLKLAGTVTIGKNKDGIIFIAVTEEGKTKIPFELIENKWGRIRVEDTTPETVAAASLKVAKAYLKILRVLLDNDLDRNVVERNKMFNNEKSGNSFGNSKSDNNKVTTADNNAAKEATSKIEEIEDGDLF